MWSNNKLLFQWNVSTTFQGIYNESTIIKHCSTWQCCYCSSYYRRSDKFDRHFENCTSRRGYVYIFNTKILLIFEENLKYKGDIVLAVCINFGTAAPIYECLDRENGKMFAVSYFFHFIMTWILIAWLLRVVLVILAKN